jgi:hypothetical protein
MMRCTELQLAILENVTQGWIALDILPARATHSYAGNYLSKQRREQEEK